MDISNVGACVSVCGGVGASDRGSGAVQDHGGDFQFLYVRRFLREAVEEKIPERIFEGNYDQLVVFMSKYWVGPSLTSMTQINTCISFTKWHVDTRRAIVKTRKIL